MSIIAEGFKAVILWVRLMHYFYDYFVRFIWAHMRLTFEVTID